MPPGAGPGRPARLHRAGGSARRQDLPARRIGAEGSVEQLATAISHPGGDWGYPVFTELGLDFPEILKDAGFETEIRFGPIRDDDLAQVYVCRKP